MSTTSILIACILLVAACATAALIPLVMPLLRRYALARPNARSSHKIPTPQGGGAPVMAVVLVAVSACAMAGFWSGDEGVARYYSSLGGAALIMALVGAVDDIRPLSAGLRLALQAFLVAAVVLSAPQDWRLAPALPLVLERVIAVLAGVWFVNLTNFMDGIDWMVVTEGVPVTAVLAVVAAFGLLSPQGGIFAASLCGALLGFAVYNRHPAKVFLGDVGSLPIGLIMAALLFELGARISVAAAIILPLYFVFDATETLFLRWRAGEKLFEAHRRHAYQNAVDGGWSVNRVNGRVLTLNFALAGLASVVMRFPSIGVQVGALMVALALTMLVSRRFRSAQR